MYQAWVCGAVCRAQLAESLARFCRAVTAQQVVVYRVMYHDLIYGHPVEICADRCVANVMIIYGKERDLGRGGITSADRVGERLPPGTLDYDCMLRRTQRCLGAG